MPVSDAVLTQILQQLEACKFSASSSSQALPTSPSSTPAPAALSTSPPSSAPVPARVALASLTDKEREKLLYPGRVNLTTYPDQHGIAPVPLTWGAASAADRGPVVCSRLPGSIKARNALGAHAGSYSIYRALSIAMGALDPTHKPDYSQTEPPVDIPPQPSWSDPTKIVSFDPWGHLVPQVFKEAMDGGVDVRPSIAVTKAHLKMSELDDAERRGELVVDGNIVLRSPVPRKVDGSGVWRARLRLLCFILRPPPLLTPTRSRTVCPLHVEAGGRILPTTNRYATRLRLLQHEKRGPYDNDNGFPPTPRMRRTQAKRDGDAGACRTSSGIENGAGAWGWDVWDAVLMRR
ncbi:hypothetical protein D9611_011754 [Ephemerocybe angulata]|uniref:GTP cyclohydrolase N-terminal domain-containing protein n=1 Tax=Ephemerocybe angulata TaxID=980116 RepID=A0A8H5FGA1_9AGAR|nr:hypothetical protein D9611_011754 [Tulosesus angulatus]